MHFTAQVAATMKVMQMFSPAQIVSEAEPEATGTKWLVTASVVRALSEMSAKSQVFPSGIEILYSNVHKKSRKKSDRFPGKRS